MKLLKASCAAGAPSLLLDCPDLLDRVVHPQLALSVRHDGGVLALL
jgi:hypothetical protein